jgi:hypothetical protein
MWGTLGTSRVWFTTSGQDPAILTCLSIYGGVWRVSPPFLSTHFSQCPTFLISLYGVVWPRHAHYPGYHSSRLQLLTVPSNQPVLDMWLFCRSNYCLHSFVIEVQISREISEAVLYLSRFSATKFSVHMLFLFSSTLSEGYDRDNSSKRILSFQNNWCFKVDWYFPFIQTNIIGNSGRF